MSEYFVDDDPSYLTMARFMNGEWEKWKKTNTQFSRMTGFEQAHSEKAFKDGFMAGFYARFFKQSDI